MNKPIGILVVDDNQMNRFVVKKLLALTIKDKEIKVSEANNGLEAIEKVTKEQVDIIVMDYNMPGLSGGETLQKMSEELNWTGTGIGFTGDGMGRAESHFKKVGVKKIFFKPDANGLVKYIKSIIDDICLI